MAERRVDRADAILFARPGTGRLLQGDWPRRLPPDVRNALGRDPAGRGHDKRQPDPAGAPPPVRRQPKLGVYRRAARRLGIKPALRRARFRAPLLENRLHAVGSLGRSARGRNRRSNRDRVGHP